MPLGTAQETSAGLPFKAAQSVGGSEVQPGVSTREPVTLAICGLWQSGGLSVYRVGGFRPLVLRCPSTHSHVCGESLRSFC